MVTQIVQFLVLNEDGSPQAFLALKNLTKKICQLLCPGIATQPPGLDFAPTPEEFESVVRMNMWQSSKPKYYRAQVDLVQAIASQILTSTGYVIFHYDGDCEWERRSECVHDPKFETIIHERLRTILSLHVDADGLAEIMSKVLVLKPFYALEAWTFQNFPKARALCAALGFDASCRILDAWEADPGLLDEVCQPDKLLALGKDYNAELTETGYPARRVYDLNKSFAASVDAALSCKPLLEALERLRPH